MRFSLTIFISFLTLNLLFIAPVTGKIVFESSYHGNDDIYTMSDNGRNLRQLTFQLAPETSPVWSPNGRQIAFNRMHSLDNWEIYVMDADGSNQRNLTNHPALDGISDWSSEGRIAFTSSRDGPWNIYAMDADGGNVTRLTHHKTGGGAAGSPSWSPDGKEIVFVQHKLKHGRQERGIYILNLARKRERRLIEPAPNVSNSKPKWSPDGTRILYVSYVNRRVDNARLMITDKDGRHHERVPVPAWDLSTGLSWAPSGREIIFTGREKGGNWEIYRFHLKTHKLTKLTNRLGADTRMDWWNSNLPVESKDVHITRWGSIKSGGP